MLLPLNETRAACVPLIFFVYNSILLLVNKSYGTAQPPINLIRLDDKASSLPVIC
jgi:hypothetical protein